MSSEENLRNKVEQLLAQSIEIVNIIRHNAPCSLRVSVVVLYKLDNRVVELYTVLQISFRSDCGKNIKYISKTIIELGFYKSPTQVTKTVYNSTKLLSNIDTCSNVQILISFK